MPTLLVIDDDRTIHFLVREAFSSSSVDVWTAGDVETGLELVRKGPDVVLLDIVLPDASGLDAVRQIQAIDTKLPVIFITGLSSSDTAIEAMKLGAYDYLLKPLDLAKVRELVHRAIEIRRLMKVPVKLPPESGGPARGDYLVGRSAGMQDVYKAIGRIAPLDVAVLIQGESGTGKELIARAIYQHSKRANQQFLAVNCDAVPETLLESELFGHEKGQQALAPEGRIGKLEQCFSGTVFLDEVGAVSPVIQNKLLRVLQEKRFERVGGAETCETDVRIIVATNRNLKQMVVDGQFREDLYYRLNGCAIEVPPLKLREDDLLLLLQHSLERFNAELGKDIHGISPEALDLLLRYTWPGNVRELETVVRRAILQATGTVILPEFLPENVRVEPDTSLECGPADEPSCDLRAWVDQSLKTNSQDLHSEIVQLTERYVLLRVLRHTRGNQSQAAKVLGITRGSLRSKIRALGINLGAAISVEGTSEDEATTNSGHPFSSPKATSA